MAIELLLGALGGPDEIFYPLVFVHVVLALAGFGSIGFAGVYASRAAQVAVPEERVGEVPLAHEGAPTAGEALVAGLASGEAGPLPLQPVPPREPTSTEPAGPARAEGPRHLLPAQVVAPGPEGPAGGGTPRLSGAQARASVGASAEGPTVDPELEELARYFSRPARFWKALLAVPVFGALALWAEPGGGGLDQVWDIGAMLVWAAAALVAGGLVVPSLRQVRSALLALGPHPGPMGRSSGSPEGDEGASPPSPGRLSEGAVRAKLARYGRLASRGAAACDVLFFVALALMIWKP